MSVSTSNNNRSGSEQRRRSALVMARLTDEELRSVRTAAERNGKSVSEFVRGLVLSAAT